MILRPFLLLSLAALLPAPASASPDQWGTEPLGAVVEPRFNGPAKFKRELPRLHRSFPTQEPPLTLAQDGAARAILILPGNAPDATRSAGKELQTILGKITGGDFPLVTEAEVSIHREGGLSLTGPDGKVWPTAIWIGATRESRAHGIDPSGLQPEGYLLRSVGPWLFLAGNDRSSRGEDTLRGTAFAVSALLEGKLGVRWLWPGELGTVIPRKKDLTLPAVNEQDEPAIRQRIIRNSSRIEARRTIGIQRIGGNEATNTDAFVRSALNQGRWSARHRLGTSFNLLYGHAYGNWWERYGKEHPEWFALQPDGSREQKSSRPRLCKGNPEVARQAARMVIETLAAKPGIHSVSISPNDGSVQDNFCMCVLCRKLDPPNADPVKVMFTLDKKRWYETYPSHSDRVATFYNRIAEEVAKTHPDAKLGAYAYSAYRDVPLGVKMHPSILVGFVGFGYFGEAGRAKDRARWDAWSQAAEAIFLRPNLLHGGLGLPAAYPHRMAEDLRHCYQTGMMAADFDSLMGHWSTQGLNYYILAKLLWDPAADVDALVEEYCRAGFGKAAPDVRDYFTRLEEMTTEVAQMERPAVEKGLRQEEDDTESAASEMTFQERYFTVFSAEGVAALRARLAKAREAEEDPTVHERIAFLETGLDLADLRRATDLPGPNAKPARVALLDWYRRTFAEKPEAINVVFLLWKTGAQFRGIEGLK